MLKTNGLTPKQTAFTQEYLIDLNATAAATRAGYSRKTAYSIGQENLKKPKIQAAISKARQQRAEKTGRTAQGVLEDIAATAREAREAGDLRTALKGYELEGNRRFGSKNNNGHRFDITKNFKLADICPAPRKLYHFQS